MKRTYRAFSAGELSPDMYGRYDVDKFGTGCITLKNGVIMAQGGVFFRPGTRMIAPNADRTKKSRLIDFVYSTVQNYALEFANNAMRVHKDGGQVLEAAKTITGITQANPAVITSNAHGFNNGDVVFVAAVLGMTEVNARWFTVAGATANTFQLSGINSTGYTAYTSGGTVSRVYSISTPYTESQLFDLYYTQSADVMTICHPSYAPRELARTGHTSWTMTEITFLPSISAPNSPSSVATVGAGATTYRYRVTAIKDETYEESLPSVICSNTNDLSTAGNKNTVSWTAVPGAIKYNIYKESSGTYGFAGSSESTSFVDQNIAPTVADTPPRYRNPFVVFATAQTITGATQANPCQLTIAAHGLSNGDKIYVDDVLGMTQLNNQYYTVTVTGANTITIGVNSTGYSAYTSGGSSKKISSNDNPSVTTYQKQRLVFAATPTYPDKIFMSRAGMFKNFTTSVPNQDDDAITFSLNSNQVNKIQHLLPLKELVAMTKKTEWKIDATDGIYKPTSMNPSPETNYGSSKVRPILLSNTAIFIDLYSNSVRDYAYTFESNGYDGNDLTILSKHLFKSAYIVDWAWAQSPDSLIWAVFSDGSLRSLTYLREHKVWGWARHETSGYVESVCVVPDETNRRDTVYFSVKRTIAGTDQRFIEHLESYIDNPVSDAYFVDCGITQTNGSPSATVNYLWHLEGQEVSILADGNVLEKQTVSGGKLTLPNSYTKVHVGLGYTMEIQPLPTETDQGEEGSTKGDPRRIKSMYLEVYRTRGLKGGQNADDEYLGEMYPTFTNIDMSSPITTLSGIAEIGCNGEWDGSYVAPYVTQQFPLPAKILSVTPVFAS